MHAAKVVAKRFLPGVPPAPKLTKHQPGLIGRLTRKLIRGGTKKFVAAGRTGIRSGVRTAGSSLRAGGYLDADRAAFRAAQTAWQKPTRFGLKQAGRPVKWAARHTARAAMRATARVTMLGAKAVVAAMGAAGALLPVLIGIIGIVAALCAILPSFITGAGAENHRRQAAQTRCVGGSTPGHAVTAAEVAEFLPNPNGKDISLLLTAEQRATATAIVEEGQKAGIPPRGWAIALMTAMQESTMGANPSTKKPNADVDVGVFQQRAKVGWYADGATVEENTNILNDVHYAARTFYLGHDVAVRHGDGAGSVGYHIPGLTDIEGWQSMDLGQAAQKVQVSAFPDYYSKHEATVASLLPTIQTQGCTAITTGSSPAAGVDDYAPVRRDREGLDDWAFYWGECVSYAAFAVRTYSPHKDFVNNWRGAHFGNAKEWDEAARKLGIRVDQIPTVGAVAQHSRNGYGHVAYITAVHEDGTFDVNEYNHGPRHKFGTRSHVSIPKDFDVVIHFEEPLAS
ncbi:CHAP domain-containing protein [Arachnia rubra]|uniref:CHAP domain-containing protein n=2 Tax=Arachnia rubra TaxID=1547448 RepID=A0ABX7Y3R8_9ACTN|nr:CHAP domain-containing protein [Arachnia rubra]QUC07408.1 CHAP domain-containing protein [Arachnia rubra]